MQKKILIIFIILLVISGAAYLYKTKLAKPSRVEIRSFCYTEAIKEAQEKFEREHPEEKEEIERGAYVKEDYDKYYNQCLIEEGY